MVPLTTEQISAVRRRASSINDLDTLAVCDLAETGFLGEYVRKHLSYDRMVDLFDMLGAAPRDASRKLIVELNDYL